MRIKKILSATILLILCLAMLFVFASCGDNGPGLDNGNQGDTGDKGDSGQQGDAGDQGEIEDPGDQGSQGSTSSSEGIVYRLSYDGSYAEVVAYNGTATEIKIADTYEGVPVKIIGKESFSGKNIKSVTIPDSVTSIGSSAFSYCRSLEAVYITDIAAWCGISFSRYSNPLYYAGNLYLNGELVTELIIPESVTSIGSYAFENCRSLTSITIGDSVTSIGESAFENCRSLTSITIGDSVTSIGESAFLNCYRLTSITIPDSVTSIDRVAFHGCYKLVEVINKSSLEITSGSRDNGYVGYYALEVHNGESKVVNVDDYLFYTVDGVNYLVNYIGKETELTLPESFNGESYVINQWAFCNVNITSVVIPDGVTSIVGNAFYGCASLTSITIPDSVTSIGAGAFGDCDSLTIYCKAESEPDGWASNWNDTRCPVVWGYEPKA